MTTNGLSMPGYRTLLLLGALLGVSVILGACQETAHELVMASTPDDYRYRHPIAIEESNKSVVIFVGHARGGLTAPQQSDVIGLAQIWQREATGAIGKGLGDLGITTDRTTVGPFAAMDSPFPRTLPRIPPALRSSKWCRNCRNQSVSMS